METADQAHAYFVCQEQGHILECLMIDSETEPEMVICTRCGTEWVLERKINGPLDDVDSLPVVDP